jgi:hypothetical protein
MEDKRRGYED